MDAIIAHAASVLMSRRLSLLLLADPLLIVHGSRRPAPIGSVEDAKEEPEHVEGGQTSCKDSNYP